MRKARSRRSLATALLLLPAALFLLVWFVAPLGELFGLSLSDPRGALAAYRELVTGEVYRAVLVNTVVVALVVTGISILLGYPIAYVLTRLRGGALHLAFWCVLFPFWVSVLVRTFAWMLLLERNGPINVALQALGVTSGPLPLLFNNTAVYIGMTHVMLPYAVLPIYAALLRIDQRLLLASDGLGMPGIGAAGVLVFLLSLGFFITPALLGGISNVTLSMLIEHFVNERLVWSLAAAASFILLGLTLALLFLASRLVPIGQALETR